MIIADYLLAQNQDFLNSHLGQSLSDDVVDVALSNLVITANPIHNSVHSFAEKANALGYLGRNGYDLSGIFYYSDTNSVKEDDLSWPNLRPKIL